MTRLSFMPVVFAVVFAVAIAGPAHAQKLTVNELKSKIFDAKMLERGFSKGLQHCKELNGTNFYFEVRDRVLNLEEFNRSLQNLVKQQVFNPEKRRPWNEQDAKERWTQVQKIAVEDQARCALVASLPSLQKELEELERKRD